MNEITGKSIFQAYREEIAKIMKNAKPLEVPQIAEKTEMEQLIEDNKRLAALYSAYFQLAKKLQEDKPPKNIKPGDIVYYACDDDGDKFIEEIPVVDVGIRYIYLKTNLNSNDDIADRSSWDDFGKTLFKTRGEAEVKIGFSKNEESKRDNDRTVRRSGGGC